MMVLPIALLGIGALILAASHGGGSGGGVTLHTPGVWDGVPDEGKRQSVAIMQALGVNPENGELIPGHVPSSQAVNTAFSMATTLRTMGHTQAATVIENYAQQRYYELANR